MRILIVVSVFLLAVSSSSAQDNRGIILQQAAMSMEHAATQGLHPVALRPDGPFIGALDHAGRVELEVFFVKDQSYLIMGYCDFGCDDIDLAILDREQDVLESDYLTDDVPVLNLTAEYTGPHMLRVDMASCEASSCLFGLSMFMAP